MVNDSILSIEEAVRGSSAPKDVLKAIVLITVEYIGFDTRLHQGQIVIHEELAGEMQDIFKALRNIEFPIEKVTPIVAYDWDDVASMEANNSSAFNYRAIAGTSRLSNHAFGRAIDINPRLNPYITADGEAQPEGAVYNPHVKGTFVDGDEAVSLFDSFGWEWGGRWNKFKDYQHFQKV